MLQAACLWYEGVRGVLRAARWQRDAARRSLDRSGAHVRRLRLRQGPARAQLLQGSAGWRDPPRPGSGGHVILQRLYEHRTELDLPPIGYAPSPVHWLIDLDAEGNFEGFVGLPKGRTMEVPTLVRGSDIKPMLLADNAEHVFGIAREGATENQRSRVPRKHEAFVELVRECAEATKDPSVGAVLSFLETGDVPDEYYTGDF